MVGAGYIRLSCDRVVRSIGDVSTARVEHKRTLEAQVKTAGKHVKIKQEQLHEAL